MPVRKFRRLDDAARSLWLTPGDPRIWEGAVRRWRLHQFFSRAAAPPRRSGISKFRSLEDKQRQRA